MENTSSRYNRLINLAGVGAEGWQKLAGARIALVGCGTLGGIYALNLVRLGIERLILIDRDIVEEHNLSTQVLFEEEDVRQILPKAHAAQRHLRKISAQCQISAHAAELTPENIAAMLPDADLIIDATDNFETRFLINDFALEQGIPWVYTAVVGFTGLTMAMIPGHTACLRCLLDEPPLPGSLPTCETSGVWPPAAQSIAAVGLTAGIQHLLGREPAGELSELDFDNMIWRRIRVAPKPDCPACVRRDFAYLQGRMGTQATRLCGRDMVHLSPSRGLHLDLPSLAKQLRSVFQIQLTEYLLHLKSPEAEIYLFPDGRALVKGVTEVARARAIFNRFISV